MTIGGKVCTIISKPHEQRIPHRTTARAAIFLAGSFDRVAGGGAGGGEFAVVAE